METEIPKLPRRQGTKGHAGVDTLRKGKKRPKKGLCFSKGTHRKHTNHQSHQECVGERDTSIIKSHGSSLHVTSRRGGHAVLSL